MFWRWLATGSAALLGIVGASLLDCTYSFLAPVDAFDICIELDLGVPGGSIAVSMVLILLAVGLVAYAWFPYFIERNRDKEGLEETGEALVKNVHRLPERVSGPVENLLGTAAPEAEPEEPTSDEVQVDIRQPPPEEESPQPAQQPEGQETASESLLRRVELMETLLRDERAAPRAVAKHWIELLREADNHHTRRTIDEVTFRDVNARLLALYVSPADDPLSARRKVGGELVS